MHYGRGTAAVAAAPVAAVVVAAAVVVVVAAAVDASVFSRAIYPYEDALALLVQLPVVQLVL